MKKSLLFLASLLVSAASFAQWTKPVPATTVDMDDSGTGVQFLYNIGAGGFLAGHNDWNTRASVAAKGDSIRMIKLYEDDEKTVAMGTWNLSCYPAAYTDKNKWLYVSCNAYDAMWVDAGNAEGNDSYPNTDKWVVEKQANGRYKLYNSPTFEEGQIYGALGVAENFKGNTNDTRLYIYNEAARMTEEQEGETIDVGPAFSGAFYDEWVFITPAEYEALQPKVAAYLASVSLKAAIDAVKAQDAAYNTSSLDAVYGNTASTEEEMAAAEAVAKAVVSLKKALDAAEAEYPALDFSAPTGVYNNINATAEELAEAEKQITVIINEYKSGLATFEDPYDYTDVIGDGSNVAPWTFEGTGTWHTNTWSTEGQSDGTDMLTPFCEYWIGSGKVLADAKIYQVLKDAVPGLYKFTVDARLYNEGSSVSPAGCTMFFGDESIKLDEEVSSYMWNGNAVVWSQDYFTIIAIVKETGDIEFGFNIKDCNFDWIAFKNTSLLYYGNKDVEENALALLREAATYEKVAEDTQAKTELIEAYNNAVDAYNNATTLEAAKEAAATTKTAKSALDENIAAYEKLFAKITEWEENVAEHNDLEGEEWDNFADFIQSEDDIEGYPTPSVGAMKTNDTYTLEATEIDEYIKQVDALYAHAIASSLVQGSDCTNMLTNPSFASGNFDGWTIKANTGKLGNKNVECFQTVVDIYQTVKDAPNGIYSVSVQAFERPGGNGSFDGSEEPKVFLFMNNFQTPVQNICKDALPIDQAIPASFDANGNVIYGEGNCFLDAAGAAGTWPYDYNVEDQGYIPNSIDGARIAFEAGRYVQKCYGVVENGEMKIGLTSNNQTIEWVLWANFKLTYEGKSAEALSELLPTYTETLATYADEHELTEPEAKKIQDIISQAEKAIKDNGADAMWDALIATNDALASAKVNVATSEACNQAMLALNETLDNYSETASQEAIDAAQAVLQEAVNSTTLTTEEMKALIVKMDAAATALKVPADIAEASDANPVDVTALIKNPSYENANSDGWSGSVPNHSGYNRTDMVEYWRSSFDHYQTIASLPAGTYELSLHCYSRYQDNAQTDFDAFEEGKKAEVMSAFVYAKVGDKTFSEPFRLIAEGARTDNSLISSSNSTITSQATGETLYTPNNMTTAGACFEETDEEGNPLSDEMNYLVRVVFTLDEAADVTIGCKNEDAADWNIWDGWKLTYFGTNSSKTDSGDASPVESIEAAPAKANGKYFENGRIIIVKNGVKYNVAGQAIK